VQYTHVEGMVGNVSYVQCGNVLGNCGQSFIEFYTVIIKGSANYESPCIYDFLFIVKHSWANKYMLQFSKTEPNLESYKAAEVIFKVIKVVSLKLIGNDRSHIDFVRHNQWKKDNRRSLRIYTH